MFGLLIDGETEHIVCHRAGTIVPDPTCPYYYGQLTRYIVMLREVPISNGRQREGTIVSSLQEPPHMILYISYVMLLFVFVL